MEIINLKALKDKLQKLDIESEIDGKIIKVDDIKLRLTDHQLLEYYNNQTDRFFHFHSVDEAVGFIRGHLEKNKEE